VARRSRVHARAPAERGVIGSLFSPVERKRASGEIPLRELLRFLIGRQRGRVAALGVLSFIGGAVEAATLALFAQLGSALVKGSKSVTVQFGVAHVHARVVHLIAFAGVLCVARFLLQLPMSILPAKITADVQASLRVHLIGAFTRASWGEQSRDREGQLQDTMVTQVMQATSGTLQCTVFITTTVTFLALLIAAFALNPLAATLVAFSSLLIFFLLKPFRSMGVRNARLVSRSQTQYAGAIAEGIRMAEETQVFGVGHSQRERIGGFIRTARDSVFRFQLLAKLVSNTYMSLIYLLMVGALAALYAAGKGHAGSVIAVLLLLLRAGANGQLMAATFQGVMQSLPFAERIQNTARRYEESSPPQGSRPLGAIESLAFERVSFSYRPGNPVLRDLSFEVNAGETIGIVGPSGAGKSTLVQLLLQLRAPEQGRYLVNRMPALELARADWHRLVAYVPQAPRLLHATVADNIRYFRPIDDEEVHRAARLARIEDDILQWDEDYETIVGPRADAVSGGQQQRICLARALAARPSMLVLDEPTSALDPRSETLIQESLAALKDELTLFIVAHRMSTLDVCDRVMVIIDGRLVAFDTRELLQEQNAYYRSASLIAAGTGAGELP
jgi:ATP-binding cassette, subfamily B, bacterial